jgi:predicted ATPase
MMAYSLLTTGRQGRRHCDRGMALYEPAYRQVSLRFGWDAWICTLGLRSQALGFLGYPEAALSEANQALKEARDLGHSQTLFQAFNNALVTQFLCGNYATVETLANELLAAAEEQKLLAQWKPVGVTHRGLAFAAAGRTSEAVQLITAGLAAYRSMGATFLTPVGLSLLGKSYADLDQPDDAWRSINEAKEVIEKSGETWFAAYVDCIAGEIAFKSPEPELARAEACFERGLAVARQQDAKSWELHAATRMAGLWRDQGKRREAHDLLAPIYDWFTEGFDTRDLKVAKALLADLA